MDSIALSIDPLTLGSAIRTGTVKTIEQDDFLVYDETYVQTPITEPFCWGELDSLRGTSRSYHDNHITLLTFSDIRQDTTLLRKCKGYGLNTQMES